jgi:cytochrome b pre-mRNA-processing protein 3
MPAHRSLWDVLTRRQPHDTTATDLYGRLVAHARTPAFYAVHGVPDTPEGRLELIVLHLVLMLRRLAKDGEPGSSLSRAISETFVTDMDDCMREMGVSDISVARKVKKVAAALFDRIRDYGAALDKGDRDTLSALIARHIQEAPAITAGANRIADFAFDAEAGLARAELDEIKHAAHPFPTITE